MSEQTKSDYKPNQADRVETKEQHDTRMAWWSEAGFRCSFHSKDSFFYAAFK